MVGWTTASSPRLTASGDKYILQLKKITSDFPSSTSWSLGFFLQNISQRNNSNIPDFASDSVLVLKSISGNPIGSLLEIHVCQEEWSSTSLGFGLTIWDANEKGSTSPLTVSPNGGP